MTDTIGAALARLRAQVDAAEAALATISDGSLSDRLAAAAEVHVARDGLRRTLALPGARVAAREAGGAALAGLFEPEAPKAPAPPIERPAGEQSAPRDEWAEVDAAIAARRAAEPSAISAEELAGPGATTPDEAAFLAALDNA
jgi:hypothetical protein